MLGRCRFTLGVGRVAFIYPGYLESYFIVEMNDDR